MQAGARIEDGGGLGRVVVVEAAWTAGSKRWRRATDGVSTGDGDCVAALKVVEGRGRRRGVGGEDRGGASRPRQPDGSHARFPQPPGQGATLTGPSRHCKIT